MSMNLLYEIETKNGRIIYEDFEFQTPTNLTYEVLATEDKKEQFEIIKAYIIKNNISTYIIEDIKNNLFNSDTILGQI